MPLSDDLIKMLQKKYEPSTMINMRFKGNDIAFRTDKQGNAILFFIGKQKEEDLSKESAMQES